MKSLLNTGIVIAIKLKLFVFASELNLAPEKDDQHSKLHEIKTAKPQQQLLLLSQEPQSTQNAHY